MDPQRRPHFNAAFNDALFRRFIGRLERDVGPIPFTVAETPLFFTQELLQTLVRHAQEIVGQLSTPERLEVLKRAIPDRYRVPGMDPLPNCVQVDFALTEKPGGGLDGRVVELQAFPSLYALMVLFADAWKAELNELPGLAGDWTCLLTPTREAGIELMRQTIVADCDPSEVVLVDLEPEQQKTSSDFVATRKLFGVESCCVTKLKVDGKKLYRERDGKRVPVKRIYNRMVFDELEVKKAAVPFRWNDELDVTWCSHPNWYWVWSKYSLPHLDHVAVPKARYLSELKEIPADLGNYVLKPLFSFAGSGVVVDVDRAAIDRVPAEQRSGWVLQDKITYANAIRMPDGNGVKAEVRVMLLRPPGGKELTPLIPLVRLSRGKMLGVDFNKNLSWTGGSVGIWAR
jgi:hypothetical protein